MPRNHIKQTYVPTKKISIPALEIPDLSPYRLLPHIAVACAHLSEPTPPLDLPAITLDGRWLPVPTAERCKLLLSTEHPATSTTAPNTAEQHSSQ